MAFNTVKITDLDLEFLKNYLKVDYEEDDALIELLGASAISFIKNYLNLDLQKEYPYKADMPDEFTVAALMLISHWYDNRAVQQPSTMSMQLEYSVKGLLDQHRKWQVRTEVIIPTEKPPLPPIEPDVPTPL